MIKFFINKLLRFYRRYIHIDFHKKSILREHVKCDSLIKQDKPFKCNKGCQKLFDMADEGDLVLAHMPLPEDQLMSIPEGHRVRPYYIAYKLNDGFIAYSSSSSSHGWLSGDKTYCLSSYKYTELEKTSYLNLFDPYYLPKDKLLSYICTINDSDYNQINRRLWIGRDKEYENLFKEKPVLCRPIPGDIILNKGRMLAILLEINDSYVCFQVFKSSELHSKNNILVHCNLTRYELINNRIIIKKNDDIKIIDIINKDDFNYLNQTIKKRKGSWSSIPQGTIFSINDNHYYCYRFNNEVISAYKVKTHCNNEKELQTFQTINIDSDVYYVDTSSLITIDDIKDVKNLIQVPVKYIHLIEDLTKNKQRSKYKNKYYLDFEIGTIFKNIYEEEYVYLYSNKSYDYCIKVSEYLDEDNYPKYPIYETKADEMIKTGIVSDQELHQILIDQINYGNDNCGILKNALTELN